MQFAWLVQKGFKFHHYRAPGHGWAQANKDSLLVSASGDVVEELDEGSAEFVYYCWPGDAKDDMVPDYSTSIEGATGLCFSPDLTKVLLVWERGAWNTPGGAVNAGECKVEALARELREEVGVKVDTTQPIHYLAGWSSGRARDNLMNDNFSAFAVVLQSEAFQADNKEISEAQWFVWAEIMAQWDAQGQPGGKKVKSLELGQPRADPAKVAAGARDDGERNVMGGNVLKWLDVHRSDRGFQVKTSTEEKDSVTSMKASWGMAA